MKNLKNLDLGILREYVTDIASQIQELTDNLHVVLVEIEKRRAFQDVINRRD